MDKKNYSNSIFDNIIYYNQTNYNFNNTMYYNQTNYNFNNTMYYNQINITFNNITYYNQINGINMFETNITQKNKEYSENKKPKQTKKIVKLKLTKKNMKKEYGDLRGGAVDRKKKCENWIKENFSKNLENSLNAFKSIQEEKQNNKN